MMAHGCVCWAYVPRASRVRSCWKLSLMEPMPAGFEMDPLVDKSQLITDGGSASVITHLKRQKKNKPCTAATTAREE